MPETPTLPKYPRHALVTVYPFTQRAEGDEVIIANQTQSSFLCLPREALEMVAMFGGGQTIGEAQAMYQRRHGVIADVDDLLETLQIEGFLSIDVAEPAGSGPSAIRRGPSASAAEPANRRRYHFENIPVDTARRLFSPPVLAASGVLVGLGLLACALDPTLVPPPTVLVFQQDQVSLLGAWLLISLASVFVHELAHLVAARAAGIPSRMGLGNRLWVVVAETDMTGIWMASKRQRCLAFLAGPIVDLTSSAALVLVLFAHRQQWIQLHPTLVVLTQACLFQYLARLLWQFEFFVPTDFYYLIGALFGCRNLMQDTQTYLLNQLARVLPRLQTRDTSGVPVREMRVVRCFAVFWLFGRAVAFGTLLWITVPVLVGYGAMLARGIGGSGDGAGPLAQGPLLPLIAVALQMTGLLMWLRGFFRTRPLSRREIQ